MSVATFEQPLPPSRRTAPAHILAHILIIALAVVMLYPPLWMLLSSFKPSQLIFSEPGLPPQNRAAVACSGARKCALNCDETVANKLLFLCGCQSMRG